MDNQQERSLAWLAGIIDGEGSISFGVNFRPNGNVVIIPFICISNSDAGILDEAERILRDLMTARRLGVLYLHRLKMSRPNGKSFTSTKITTNLRVNGNATRSILAAVLPYLRSEKRRNAETVLKYLESRDQGLLLRNHKGQVRRLGYRQSEIDLVVATRTHRVAAKSSEALRSAPNVFVG